MIKDARHTMTRVTSKKASTLSAIWMIARRQMLEAIRDRSTLTTAGFLLVLQTVLVLVVLAPAMRDHPAKGMSNAGFTMAFYLLVVGLMPSATAIGIASGAFAGDKERGSLMPLLVTPASNTAIFAGKVLGAVLPALLYGVLGISVYFAEIALLYGPGKLGLLPPGLTVLIILLIPAIALFGAGLSCLISSRVRTYQSAQNYSSLISIFLWLGLFALLFVASAFGVWTFALALAGVFMIDVLLICIGVAMW